jgi:hypothetical protein
MENLKANIQVQTRYENGNEVTGYRKNANNSNHGFSALHTDLRAVCN